MTEVMPRRNVVANNARAAPTAPPAHLMPDSIEARHPTDQNSCSNNNQQHPTEPPPRYEEAIADSASGAAASGAGANPRLRPLQTSQLNHSSASESNESSLRQRPSRAANDHHHHHQNSLNQSVGNLSASGGSRGRPESARFRSASPSQLSEDLTQRNSSDDQNDDGTTSSTGKKKKKPGSKIKKGLENIAFFIIQILD